ncbi:MAG: cell division protein FtsA [Myxococcota bacterium]|jgi:cell division protein FtsA|nr:cell division protein FtsA [Myxococcota bacterium]
MAKHGELIVGLDIGTTKVCVVVGEVTEDGIDVIGIGSHPSKGLRKGVVINLEATVSSIKRAVEEAELMAGCEISTVHAGISGGHIRGFNSHGVVAIKSGEVTANDVARCIEAAKAVAIPSDRQVLHVIPQEYIIDGQAGIHEAIGMAGVRLEAKVHIVTGAVSSAQNIIKACNKCGLNVSALVLDQVASSSAVLTEEEKELGCAVVDIGGGTTDIALWSRGTVVHSSVVAVGGNHLTNDIAVGLRSPMAEAERIKHKAGCAMVSMVGPEELIEIPSVGGRAPRSLPRRVLAEIIEPRMEEIFALVHREIQNSGFEEQLSSGVVLTGGTAILDGIPELAEQILQLPVRRGLPRRVGGLVDVVRSPKFSTAVGLVGYGASHHDEDLFKVKEERMLQRMRRQISSWFREIV